jgi:hypothetical protein
MIDQSTLDKTIQTPSHLQTPSLIITKKNQVKKHMKKHFLDEKTKNHFCVLLLLALIIGNSSISSRRFLDLFIQKINHTKYQTLSSKSLKNSKACQNGFEKYHLPFRFSLILTICFVLNLFLGYLS